MSREFSVRAPGPRAWLLPGIALGAAAAGILIALLHGDHQAAWAVPVLLLCVGLIAFTLRRRRISLENGVLTIAAGVHTHRVAVLEIDANRSRIIDLREQTQYKPMLKTFGSGMAGYQSGHFRLRNRDKAFTLLTDRTRVLMLQEKSGRKLLLSLEQPQALLDELRRVAPRRSSR
ncbi:PH (Pleckstrin Homology) domain-containing protein [Luteimonas cucumeris]|uniref:PH (Pleckstrin Homology) domain-containing protein n=1 Tax=Luteimonas cucumeris TaxID=985012 RepID=A0A562KUK7_9GAMM|nr:PH domain-containing protein [Luteimonas cucumeris]TWH99047.1 PH (Pleckstrin Homology) domain-containing protein [Luteimonas cucumeris]